MRNRLVILFILIVIGFTPAFVMSAGEEPAGGILYTQPVESVIFRHQDHSQKGISCNTCHSGLFAMEALNVQKNKDFTMASLYKGKYCGACHNGKSAFASDTQCARCHLGSNMQAPQKESPAYKKAVVLGKRDQGVAFNHDTHAKKATCRSCHPSLFKPKEGADKITMADHSQKKYCFTCHDRKGKDTFAWSSDCNRCHQKSMPAPKETIKFGKGVKAVAFKHESHQFKAGCRTCHPGLYAFRKGEAKIDFDDHVNKKSCFTCHARKSGSAFYDCNRCHQDKPAVKAAFYPDTLKYQTTMQNVYFHHESHVVFSCNTCHSAPFAMKKGKTKMNMSEMYQGKTCGMCHNGTKAFSARECAKCHKQ
ncbi:MAG: c(7)-type cytochrome triheme domain-containing protein [Smithellaceae bacterium]